MDTATKVISCVALSIVAHGAFFVPRWIVSQRSVGDVPDDRIFVSSVSIGGARVSEPVASAAKPAQRAHMFAPASPAPASVVSVQPQKPQAPAAVKRSEELLTDPQKGKAFRAYFTSVREEIEKTVKDKYDRSLSASGSITLLFILSSDGRLQNASVLQNAGRANDNAKDFAMQCLRQAAPFGPFPKELSLDKIAFNITVRFES